jgi:hypothetical protein
MFFQVSQVDITVPAAAAKKVLTSGGAVAMIQKLILEIRIGN